MLPKHPSTSVFPLRNRLQTRSESPGKRLCNGSGRYCYPASVYRGRSSPDRSTCRMSESFLSSAAGTPGLRAGRRLPTIRLSAGRLAELLPLRPTQPCLKPAAHIRQKQIPVAKISFCRSRFADWLKIFKSKQPCQKAFSVLVKPWHPDDNPFPSHSFHLCQNQMPVSVVPM